METELRNVINNSIKNHKISEAAHEEIYALQHSDSDVAKIFLNQEIEATNKLIDILGNANISTSNLNEKAHIIVSLIDNLCHEVVYHKHKNMDYNAMIDIIVKTVLHLLEL